MKAVGAAIAVRPTEANLAPEFPPIEAQHVTYRGDCAAAAGEIGGLFRLLKFETGSGNDDGGARKAHQAAERLHGLGRFAV